ncbi:MAG TPA: YbfB/YjiJ family MFS transporter [Burkholderiales bacterium]|nr:YbfB/YjiJ family MFS transporter [Burkholderiales bacterium]
MVRTLQSTSAAGRPISAIGAAVTGCAALAVAQGVGRFAFTPILPMMQADAGVSVVTGGWLAAANYLGYLVGALAAARVHMRAAAAVRAALALVVLATLAMGVVDGLASWLALRFAAGVASAWIMVFGCAWALQQLAKAGAPLLGGVVFAGVGAGITAVGVGVAALHASASSGETWLAIGAASLAASAAIWMPLSAGRAAPAPSRARTAAAKTGRHGLILAYGLAGFGYIVPATFLPTMARQAIADASLFVWSWPVFGAAAMISTLLAAALTRALGTRRVWALAQAAMGVGVALPLILHGTAGVMLSAAMVGGTFMVTTMAGIQVARETGGDEATQLIAAMTAAFALGQLAGPVVVSSVAAVAEPFPVAIPLASALLFLGAVLVNASPAPQTASQGAHS